MACREESCGLFEQYENTIFTGVGKINASYNLTKKLSTSNIDLVVNFGSVGSNKFNRGDLVYCRKFIQYDMDAREFGYKLGITPNDDKDVILEHKKMIQDLPEAICGTADTFSPPDEFKDIIDVADMESYAMAKICKKENIDFFSIKYITNNFNSGDAYDWDEECKKGAKIMYDYFNKNILKNV